jgi:transcriptional regulator with XRE-family HTH domain
MSALLRSKIRNIPIGKEVDGMYRYRLEEVRKEKGLSNKRWSEESGVSLDTIARIIHPENPDKDSPRVNTLNDLCKALGVELWEIFYLGDRSFVSLQAEVGVLKAERDDLIAENAILRDKIESLRDKVDSLKDDIIAAHNYYNKLKSNN